MLRGKRLTDAEKDKIASEIFSLMNERALEIFEENDADARSQVEVYCMIGIEMCARGVGLTKKHGATPTSWKTAADQVIMSLKTEIEKTVKGG